MPFSTRNAKPPARPLLLAAALAVLVFAVLSFALQPPDLHTSDFYSFWAGARLVGPGLYDAARAEAIQHDVSPQVTSKRYIRPPFYALALWPLGRLPFRAAYVVWSLLNLAAALAFVRLWRFRPEAYVACALFFPLGWSFGIGQDAPLLLLALSAGARLIEEKREIAGGAVLALCAAKPHLFLLIPVVIIAQRKLRALAGMLAGGAVLYLLSSAVMGPGWPVDFARAALDNEAGIRPRLLGMAGLLARVHAPHWLAAVALVGGAALVYRFARKSGWLPAIAYAAAAGVVFAPRALVYDAAFFLPLLLWLPSAAVVGLGAALVAVVTPAAMVAEITSFAILFLPAALRITAPVPADTARPDVRIPPAG